MAWPQTAPQGRRIPDGAFRPGTLNCVLRALLAHNRYSDYSYRKDHRDYADQVDRLMPHLTLLGVLWIGLPNFPYSLLIGVHCIGYSFGHGSTSVFRRRIRAVSRHFNGGIQPVSTAIILINAEVYMVAEGEIIC